MFPLASSRMPSAIERIGRETPKPMSQAASPPRAIDAAANDHGEGDRTVDLRLGHGPELVLLRLEGELQPLDLVRDLRPDLVELIPDRVVAAG